jgi:type IV pilus assembly protein PilC
MQATSEEAVGETLNYDGYQPLRISPASQLFDWDNFRARLSPPKPAEVILFYRQLALLLESGLDIVSALELLVGQAENRTLRDVLSEVISEVRGGGQLSAALSHHPHIFPEICCRTLRVGEQTGSLETMLRQLADYTEKEREASKGVKNALMYPAITMVVALLVVGVLVNFVLPAFGELYDSLGAEMPAMTQMLLDSADMFEAYGVYLTGGLGAVILLIYTYIRTEKGRYRWDGLSLRIPLAGRITRLKELARACRSIALLYSAGLPMTDIMEMVTESADNKVMTAAFNDVRQDILRGEGISKPMSQNPVFLPMMVQMMRVGEESGTLDVTLMAVAQSYETEVAEKTKALIGMIQPAMTIFMGLMVGVIALSMVSAMYSIYGQMG